MRDLRAPKLLLPAILVAALVLRVGVAVYWPNVYHSDEVYQTQEPAHRLAMGFGVVTWEWREGIRSWVFPAFLAGVMKATAWTGEGSSGYLAGIAVVLSLISLTTVWFAYAWGKRASGTNAAVVGAWICAIWWHLVWFAPKPLNEVVAAHVLLPGLYLGAYGDRFPEARRMFLAGLCCGLAASLRIQLAPAVAFAAVWFCHPSWRTRIRPLALGLLLPVAAFGLVDAVTWSYPFQSFVRYAWLNVVEGRSLGYGTEPWYWYAGILPAYLGPMLVLALIGARQSPFLGWVALVIVLAHSLVAHKESRFMYSVVPILMTLAALGLTDMAAAFRARFAPRMSSAALVTASVALCALTSGLFAGAFTRLLPVWSGQRVLVAMNRLSRDSTVCGVGLYPPVRWNYTGGYTYLHRDVPIVLVPDDADPERERSFNALLAGKNRAGATGEFALVECWNDICLYQRAGPCEPAGDGEINNVLRRTGA